MSPDPLSPPRRQRHWLLTTMSFITRGVMLIAIVAVFVTATALILYGGWRVYELIAELVSGHAVDAEHMMLEAIELVDLFLLATVLDVVALGLYQLYIDDRIPVPEWLKIRSIDDLKAKLVGVVITMLGVVFAGRALTWNGTDNLLLYGGAIAAVVIALTLFLGIHIRADHAPPRGEDADPH